MPVAAHDLDAAAVRFDDRLRDVEPETRSLHRILKRTRGAEETVEEMGDVGGRDPHPGVLDLNDHLATTSPHAHVDMTAGRRELHGLRDEVVNDLAESTRIARDIRIAISLERQAQSVRPQQQPA